MCLGRPFGRNTTAASPVGGLARRLYSPSIAGVLVTTRRPLSIQRFTAAHELGHYRMKHRPSLDDESILRRMAMTTGGRHRTRNSGSGSRRLCGRIPHATMADRVALPSPGVARTGPRPPPGGISASLRLGIATKRRPDVQRLNYSSRWAMLCERTSRGNQSRTIPANRPTDYRGNVWLLTEHDAETRIDGSRNDHSYCGSTNVAMAVTYGTRSAAAAASPSSATTREP